jgi:pimeloyl-ACP methyl ester carboxylesterase
MKLLRRLLIGLSGLLLLAWLGLVAWAYWPTGSEEVPARALASPDDRFVMADGLQLRYRTWGEPGADRPTIVLVHGFGNSLQSYRLLAPRLAEGYHVVALDLPGFGLSAKPVDHDYGNAGQARVVGAFIRALGLEQVVIAGHSLGGAVALHVAVSEPGISGLVLMNPGIITTGVPAFTQYLFFPFQRINAKLFGDRAFRSRAIRGSFVDPSIITEDVMDELMLAARSEGYLAGTTSLMGQYTPPGSEIPLLAQVRVPVLIVWGGQDRSKPAGEFEQLRELLPGSTAVLIPQAGHYVHEEAAAEAAAGMLAFAQEVRRDELPAADPAP